MPDSWVELDFGARRAVRPVAYSMCTSEAPSSVVVGVVGVAVVVVVSCIITRESPLAVVHHPTWSGSRKARMPPILGAGSPQRQRGMDGTQRAQWRYYAAAGPPQTRNLGYPRERLLSVCLRFMSHVCRLSRCLRSACVVQEVSGAHDGAHREHAAQVRGFLH